MAGMKDATVRQLQIFDAAARALSFSRAAEALHLTQPAVSMQIRQLEHFAGVPLFERSGRRLHLTGAGEELVSHARAVLGALDQADEAFAALKGLRGGRVRLAVVSTAKYFAPRLIARFAQAHRGVRVVLEVANREALVRTLAANDVDLALMGRPPGELDLAAAPFADHPHVIIAPPDHPLAGRRRVDVAALAAEVFLVRELGSGTRTAMERFFREHGVPLRVGMEMPSNETIKQAVMADDLERIGNRFLKDGLTLREGKMEYFSLTPYFTEMEVRRGIKNVHAQAVRPFRIRLGRLKDRGCNRRAHGCPETFSFTFVENW